MFVPRVAHRMSTFDILRKCLLNILLALSTFLLLGTKTVLLAIDKLYLWGPVWNY